jgi:hypothetical protein
VSGVCLRLANDENVEPIASVPNSRQAFHKIRRIGRVKEHGDVPDASGLSRRELRLLIHDEYEHGLLLHRKAALVLVDERLKRLELGDEPLPLLLVEGDGEAAESVDGDGPLVAHLEADDDVAHLPGSVDLRLQPLILGHEFIQRSLSLLLLIHVFTGSRSRSTLPQRS